MALKDEILILEKRYWQALKDQDVATVMSLTDDPCLIAGAQGVSRINHDDFENMMSSATYAIDRFQIMDDAEIELLGNEVAILAYRVQEDLNVDGKPISLEAADSSTWVKRGGRWRCAMHTESIKGDPFGRDR